MVQSIQVSWWCRRLSTLVRNETHNLSLSYVKNCITILIFITSNSPPAPVQLETSLVVLLDGTDLRQRVGQCSLTLEWTRIELQSPGVKSHAHINQQSQQDQRRSDTLRSPRHVSLGNCWNTNMATALEWLAASPRNVAIALFNNSDVIRICALVARRGGWTIDSIYYLWLDSGRG